ncbi:glycoside hydrolase family 16 protein [Flavobacterium selenitireducens]|uniref:glycoside hydrolase family 16 protein n=1 Tax=Flavobacterium selenitireducens TaxID=2722704 RepID=UPI00168BDB5A|nr:glycoside hydrolase family 16 protein [Flavobacterium selenitireducens]MBD3581883.1 glycoside hydrolase family 16 protein [Flavobacterium selenitireducens]
MNYFSKYNSRNKRLAIAALSVISISLVGCNEDDKQDVGKRNWQLAWSDDFEGTAGQLPDATKWGYDLGNNGGWGNQELENYTNNPENVSLDGSGNLVITAIKNGNSYTSARVKTQNLFSQKYGRFEARLKTPYGPGIWPAFWMLGANVGEVGWPQCGEIDIMELKGQQPSIIHGTVHGPGYSAGNAISSTFALQNGRFDLEYHVFAVEWSESKIDFFVDDYLYKRISKNDVPGEWVYDHDFFLILNVAIGGNYVGFPTDQTPFPQKMIVDYVKVYK